jgi:kynureninase
MAKDDPLLAWRKRFPGLENCVHLVSHSLGCVPAQAKDDLAEFFDQWQSRSITAWDEWIPEIGRAAERIEKIIAAPAGTVTMHQNVSTVMSVLASCFTYTAQRSRIVYESLMFPTVSYVWKAEEQRGAEVCLIPSADGTTVDADAVCAAIDERTVAIPLQHVVFSSAFIQDVKKISARAREVGAHVILDCYQSIGTLPIDVGDLGVSFACGGSVKYLCGGPGAGWLYVRPDLLTAFAPRVTGWFANAKPFAFTMPEQTYADTVWRYLGGTPAIAALYQSRAGQTIVAEIGVDAIRHKSLQLTQRAIERVDEHGFTLNSPRLASQRGGSVVFDFPGASEVCRELNRRRYFCDHRPGVGVRISPHFYTKAEEIDLFFSEVAALRS